MINIMCFIDNLVLFLSPSPSLFLSVVVLFDVNLIGTIN